jgi:hypothetical protein
MSAQEGAFQWTPELDEQLKKMVDVQGHAWTMHAKALGCEAAQVRQRWTDLTTNYTKGMHACVHVGCVALQAPRLHR